MEKWVTFLDVLKTPIRNGLTKPKGIRGTGVKMIAMGEIFAKARISDMEMDRVPVTEKEMANCGIEAGDLLFARQSLVLEGAGKCSIVTEVSEPTVFESHLIRARIDKEKADPYFIFYYFNSSHGRENIKTIVEQVAAAGIRGSDLVKLSIPCPEVSEQRRVARILRSIDERIENNEKINDNLYEILQSVFQSRFGLSEESARVGTLSEICAYSKDRVAVSKLGVKNYYSTENMLPSKAGSVDAASLPTTQQTTKCNIGDVLVSNIRPYFKKIVYCQSEGGCSTDVLCFTPKLPSLSSYLFCTLYADSFFNYMVAGSKGTKMPRGDKLQIMTYPVVIPTEDELRAFDEVAQPILRQIHINSDENTYLAALRDTLLPKLMSGEIDVSDIQL